jgi:hypothetical protein
MALSPQYSWPEPDNSSLVKNGAQDIRALGDAIDTSVWNVGYGQAGKNKIINGNFAINQRSFTSATTAGYTFDRWNASPSGGTVTYSAQTFTPGSAPVAGYEGKNFIDVATTGQSAAGDFTIYESPMEDARTLAGQTVTLSFWAKAASGTPKIAAETNQNFGAGGSPSATVNTYAGNVTISTAWERYSLTFVNPSISGKTFGTTNSTGFLNLRFWLSAGSTFNSRTGSIGTQNSTISIWGVQLEYGSKATPFQTASGGSPQAELAMCQRYYQRITPSGQFSMTGSGIGTSTTGAILNIALRTSMRVTPTAVDYSNLSISDGAGSNAVTGLTLSTSSSPDYAKMSATVASGLLLYRPVAFEGSSASHFIGFTAEL